MAIPKKSGDTVRRARRLRREMSPAEVKLWCELRRRPGGLKFRRQHPADRFAFDFYCAAARLAIEVDGAFHDRGDRPERDAARDARVAGFGIETLRIPAASLYRDMQSVIDGIVAAAMARLPLHHPRLRGDGPPPQDELGED